MPPGDSLPPGMVIEHARPGDTSHERRLLLTARARRDLLQVATAYGLGLSPAIVMGLYWPMTFLATGFQPDLHRRQSHQSTAAQITEQGHWYGWNHGYQAALQHFCQCQIGWWWHTAAPDDAVPEVIFNEPDPMVTEPLYRTAPSHEVLTHNLLLIGTWFEDQNLKVMADEIDRDTLEIFPLHIL